MTRRPRPFVAALFSLALLAPAAAARQSQVKQQQPTKKSSAATAAEADPLAEVRRATAVNLVNSLADEARNFSDPTLRARVQARSADALWEADGERARALFRRAWDAALAADEENERRMEEEKRRQTAERGYFSMRRPPSLRTEVLRLAARRDRALGEEFLARMEEPKKAGDATASTQPDAQASNAARARDPQESPPAVEKRLRLAVQLLEDGDAERALQFAEPALNFVTVHAVDFLSRLRPRNSVAADQRYATLLARAQSDPASDANTASLLSAYLFTPSLYITFEPGGGSNTSSWGGGLTPPTDVAPALRAAFFNAAGSILMRPIAPAEQDQTSTGRGGAYMVIARLLPLFEQHAGALAAGLKSKLAALTPDTPEHARQPGNNAVTRGLVPEDPNRDRVQETLNRLERAKTADERAAVYADAAMDAAGKKDPRAREFVEKIEDTDVRRQLRGYLDFEALDDAVKSKDAREVLRLARAGEFPPVQRVWGLTEAARLLSKDEPGRAVEILEEATEEARRIDQGTPERVRALVAIVTRLAELDRPRMWDMLSEVVKASNATADFTGEDGFIEVNLRTKMSTNRRSSSAESFDLAGLFAALARENLDRAAELARGFKAEHPRAAATLAVARTVLDRKSDRAAR